MRHLLRLLLTGTVLLTPSRMASAQTPLEEQLRCVREVPAFRTSDAAELRRLEERLRWPSPAYFPIRKDVGSRDSFRELRLAADTLAGLVRRDQPGAAALLDSLEVAMVEAEAAIGGDSTRLAKITVALRPLASLEEAQTVVVGAVGSLRFRDEDRLGMTAICMIAKVAHRFLAGLQERSARNIEAVVAEASRDWRHYAESAPSMTVLERLGTSCRLGFASRLFVDARCDRSTRDLSLQAKIAPPRLRSVVLHPRAGLRPIATADSAFTAGTVIELYGILRHEYRENGLRTWGASIASLHVVSGRSHLGGVLHLGVGALGIFESDRRAMVVLSADVLGWSPGTRAAMAAIPNTIAARLFKP